MPPSTARSARRLQGRAAAWLGCSAWGCAGASWHPCKLTAGEPAGTAHTGERSHISICMGRWELLRTQGQGVRVGDLGVEGQQLVRADAVCLQAGARSRRGAQQEACHTACALAASQAARTAGHPAPLGWHHASEGGEQDHGAAMPEKQARTWHVSSQQAAASSHLPGSTGTRQLPGCGCTARAGWAAAARAARRAPRLERARGRPRRCSQKRHCRGSAPAIRVVGQQASRRCQRASQQGPAGR